MAAEHYKVCHSNNEMVNVSLKDRSLKFSRALHSCLSLNTNILASSVSHLVERMADCGVSLHCYAEREVNGARHGDLRQGENNTH